MSKLVKTGLDIYYGVRDLFTGVTDNIKERDQKYLILPDGLDKLEEMLKEEYSGLDEEQELTISSVFARFKKENNL